MKKRQKKIVEKEEITDNKKIISKIQETQIKWTIIVIVIVFILFLGTYYSIKLYQYNSSRFEYLGAKWEIGGTQEHPTYRATFPFLFSKTFGLYMNNDPRTNNVSIENISIKLYSTVVTAYDHDLELCQKASVAQINLVYFLTSGAGIKVVPAMFNETQSIERNVTFADCSSVVNKTVIMLKKSEYPSIEQDKNNTNCYIINVGNCDNEKAVEKFMLTIMKQLIS